MGNFNESLTNDVVSFEQLGPGYYENVPIQIYWKFYHQKNENFQILTLLNPTFI